MAFFFCFSKFGFLAIPAILAISSRTPATYLMAMCYAEKAPPVQRYISSPLEAAVTGTQTVGHRPQRCRPFWSFLRINQLLLLIDDSADAAPVRIQSAY